MSILQKRGRDQGRDRERKKSVGAIVGVVTKDRKQSTANQTNSAHNFVFIVFYLFTGGGGTLGGGPANKLSADLPLPGLGGVVTDRSLMDMATKGEDGVPLSCLVKLAKLAYSYEQWDYFDTFLEAAHTAIKVRY